MLSDKTQQIIDALDREFMATDVRHFSDAEAREYCRSEFDDDDDDDDDSSKSGYYARLSASGYMDCTDWSGPFETSDEAYENLAETHGDSVVIDQVEYDDITTDDGRTFYRNGKVYLTTDPDDTELSDVGERLQAKFEADGHFPSVWWVSDHGNISRYEF